ncbi:S8 family serine peptidase [Puniceicoccaceae bacterium K14]|nr:S8 family serine peptidase [Puniceicoccaceae bacterium K14]
MKPSKAFIIITMAAIVCVGISYLLSWKSKNSASQRVSYSYPKKQDTNSSQSRRATSQSSIEITEEDLASLLEDVNEEAHLSDEQIIISQDDATFQELLESLSKNGINVINSNKALRAIRVKLESEEDFRRLNGLTNDSDQLENNYLVYLPTPQLPEATGPAGTAFGNTALESMGVPANNEDWGSGIKVAVLDTGVSQHSEFGDMTIDSIDLIDSTAEYAHGTAVASLIAGENTGVAPATSLLSIRVLDGNGIGDSYTLAEGIIAAVENGSDIISMSVGSYGYSQVLENAVNYASEQGVILVASTGNDGASQITYPARFDAVVAVTAVDADSQIAGFSNYGKGVDIAAPGVGVVSAWSDEEWSYFSGTSAAVPYVTGSLSSLLSENPGMSSEEAIELITTYTNDTGASGFDEATGNGILNIERIANREEEGIYDLAISDFYLDYENATAAVVPIEITVQNRGTETINSLTLTYAEQASFEQERSLERLEPNATTSYQISVPRVLLDSEEGYSLQASIESNGTSDSTPENNIKETLFKKNEDLDIEE